MHRGFLGRAFPLVHPSRAAGGYGARAFGHGTREELSSDEALAVAARASAYAPVQVEGGQGFEAGMQVTVAATDYATDPVSGTLVGLANDEVTIERSDPRAGTVRVHFPRIGYQIRSESA
jgi:hypothetical protein